VDLDLTASRRLLLMYAEDKNIPTEHAQLDDNGDGRGSEVQLDYLEEDRGGRRRAGPPAMVKQGQDGALAAGVLSVRASTHPTADGSTDKTPVAPGGGADNHRR